MFLICISVDITWQIPCENVLVCKVLCFTFWLWFTFSIEGVPPGCVGWEVCFTASGHDCVSSVSLLWDLLHFRPLYSVFGSLSMHLLCDGAALMYSLLHGTWHLARAMAVLILLTVVNCLVIWQAMLKLGVLNWWFWTPKRGVLKRLVFHLTVNRGP